MARNKPAGVFLSVKNLHFTKDKKGIKITVRIPVKELPHLRHFIDRAIAKS
jgi:hypothetical protein